MGWKSKFLCPILQPSGISHSQQQRLLANVLIGWIIGEKHIPSETFGSGGTVYHWPREASHLTVRIRKEVQIFLASFFGFSTLGMVVSSTHQCGMSNWWFHQSSHTLMFLIEGSNGEPPTANVWVGYGHLWGHTVSCLWVNGGTPLLSRCIPKGCPWGTL